MPRRNRWGFEYLLRDDNRHGKVRWYVRPPGRHKKQISDHPSASPKAMAEYHAALKSEPTKSAELSNFLHGSFGWVCSSYLSSAIFLNRAALTQVGYRRQIDKLRAEFGKHQIRDFQRRHIQAIIDRKATTPGEANNVLKSLSVIFNYALRTLEIIDKNPVHGISKLRTDHGGSKTWRQEHADQFRATWPLGSPQRTLFEIMWSTGLRIGDALRLGPQHITKDGRILLRADKNAADLNNPIMTDLAEALAAAPARHLTYLATQGGRTRSSKAAYTWFSAAAREAGLPKGFTAHGCRKGLLTAMAEAGKSAEQMKAVTGIRTDRVLSVYIKDANRQLLSDTGLSGIREPETGTGKTHPSEKVRQKTS